MVRVILAERRSAVLTPSSLACLAQVPTVNLTVGCAHGCLYCYARGYSSYPGENTVVLYGNTLERLKDELARKRRRPQAVYFSPSSDLFQPVAEVLALGQRVLEFLLSRGIGVAFLSKGHIPDGTMKLLIAHADRVRAQIGIITLDEDLQRLFEPHAASPKVRLEQMARLVSGGIATQARLVPVLPGLTDSPDSLGRLFRAIARAGVKRATVSALFLRPAIAQFLRRNIPSPEIKEALFGCYRGARRLAVPAERSSVIALPWAKREEIYARAKRLASEWGIELSVCSCMNPDIAAENCGISGRWPIQGSQLSFLDWAGRQGTARQVIVGY